MVRFHIFSQICGQLLKQFDILVIMDGLQLNKRRCTFSYVPPFFNDVKWKKMHRFSRKNEAQLSEL